MEQLVVVLLCMIGMSVGGQLNRAIYRWAWNSRQISPWSKPPEGADPRTWSDCLPVVGWWGMRRESSIHGRGFWLRPMLIELGSGIGLASLYWCEVVQLGRLPVTFTANAILFALMIIATFIDIDEKTIPDSITLPGTLIALCFAVFAPHSLLPDFAAEYVLLTSPAQWLPALDGNQGLGLALLCWFGWCYALLPKTIYARRGIAKAATYLVASIIRHPWSVRIGGMGIIGAVAVFAVWSRGGEPWQALLSSLTGLAFAGGLVWAIRAVSGYMLGVEAMGFGDVTLMAMIGAFLGWQAALITFFIAPFTSLFIALSQWLMTGRRDIPFGPFLCAGASIVIIGWESLWARWSGIFGLGIFIPAIIVVGIGLMGLMLGVLQIVKRIFGISHQY